MIDRVTYLLGAGASYNALPIVSGMNERMNLFYKFLLTNKKGLHDFKSSIRNYKKVLDDFKIVLNEAQKHTTIDTYAKKIFLKNNSNSDSKEMIALKFFLAGYFIFEQAGFTRNDLAVSPGLSAPINYDVVKDKHSQVFDSISKRVDPRYDVFFATLLENREGTLKLPPNVNIVSWNYDYQMELAYQEYISNPHIGIVQDNLNFFSENSLNPSWYLNNSQIIKLNGSAGNLFQESHTKRIRPIVNVFNSINTESCLRNLFENYLNVVYSKHNTLKIPYLNFAWELGANDISEHAVESAREIIHNSEIVVVIGYSFPNFNREIDKRLFENSINLKKVYYQVPKENVAGLSSRLKGILPSLSNSEIIPHTDLDQFFIPYEL